MRMIMEVLAADEGIIRRQGSPVTSADRRSFGHMPEERGVDPKQAVLEQLVYIGRLPGLTAPVARERALTLLERFGLADRADTRLE